MGHLDDRLVCGFDELPAAERNQAIRHAVGCARCRIALLAEDPSRAFSLLALEPVPQEALETLSRRVDAEIDGPTVRSRPTASPWLAPLAASVLLAAALVVLGGLSGDDAVPGAEPAFAPIETAEIQRFLEDRAPVEGVEILSSPGDSPEVLDLAVGDTQIVMIFDEALEL